MSRKNNNKIGFIGAGRMAQALARGMAQRHPQLEFAVADPLAEACDKFKSVVDEISRGVADSRVKIVNSNQTLFASCNDVVLAVKPQCFPMAAAQIDPGRGEQPLVISVIAGITIGQIQKATQTNSVIRLMPNTPCLIGQGVTAMACSDTVAIEDRARIAGYLESVGLVQQVNESLLDAVTGLSGSGPAYVFQFIEALVQGGLLVGLPLDVANRLAVQTVLGAAKMVQQTAAHPAVLRDQVTSPGGTTIAGLKALAQHGFDLAVISAVESAAARANELGRPPQIEPERE